MSQEFVPRPYQVEGLDWLDANPRCALWAGMGMGKTVTVLSHLEREYNLFGRSRPTLVIAPKRVALNVWPAEVRKWNHLNGLDVVPIIGSEKERIAALRRDAPIYTINYDNLVWLRKYLKTRWPWGTVVADESTRLKNHRMRKGGRRALALSQPARQVVGHWINLTATPSPNGLVDLWGQTWFLDFGERLGNSYTAFEDRWFQWKGPPGAKTAQEGLKQIALPHAEEEIHQRVSDICLTLDPHDWFNFNDPITNSIEVDLPRNVRRSYDEVERSLFTELESGESVEAMTQAAGMIKCLQMANGAVYHDESKRDPQKATLLHSAKLEALESIVEEAAGAPVLVAYWFQPDLRLLQKRFPRGRVFDADPSTEVAWNAGEIPVMFIHPQSAAHGVNLQDGGNTIVFFSHWWDSEVHDQVIERIGPVRQIQSGHDRPVYVHYIVARDTMDQAVIDRNRGKRDAQQALLDYANRRKR